MQVDAIGLGAIFALMAVGIGLVFGVMRLVNFAYGQLIMAGAFALAFASERDWPVGVGIALCFAVVLALSLAMERVVFRPLRTQSAAVMLIATFAVAFLLQSIALLWFGPLGKTATSLVQLNRPVSVGGVDIRKIAIVAIVTAAVCLVLLRGAAQPHVDRPAHAGRRDRLADRTSPGRAREPREHGGRAHRGRPRGRRRRDAHRPVSRP